MVKAIAEKSGVEDAELLWLHGLQLRGALAHSGIGQLEVLDVTPWPAFWAADQCPLSTPSIPIVPVNPITRQSELDDLCVRLASSPEIAYDTEFVSEDSFHPELCLIQIASRSEMAVVDPQTVDITPFWKLLVAGNHVTVLHAGREELNFLLRSVGQTPQRLFDVQLASGFCSHEYPAAYGSVVSRFLGQKPVKGEQRTDWRRRPLTGAQLTARWRTSATCSRCTIGCPRSLTNAGGRRGSSTRRCAGSNRSSRPSSAGTGGASQASESSMRVTSPSSGSCGIGVTKKRNVSTAPPSGCCATICWWKLPVDALPDRTKSSPFADCSGNH